MTEAIRVRAGIGVSPAVDLMEMIRPSVQAKAGHVLSLGIGTCNPRPGGVDLPF